MKADNPGDMISADDHFEPWMIPGGLWIDRIAISYREKCPRLERLGGGRLQWMIEGAPWAAPWKEDDMHRIDSAPARLAAMSLDGVSASVIYPPPSRFPARCPELRLRMFQAYNDWALEFVHGNEDSLAVIAQLPAHDPGAAQEELLRVAGLGHRGVQLAAHEYDVPPFHDTWRSFWRAAAEIGLPVSFHIGGGVRSLSGARGGWMRTAMVAVMPMQLDEAIAGLVFSGVLEDNPRLKVVLAESGIGWLPYLIDRMDYEFTRQKYRGANVLISEKPSRIVRRNMLFTFGADGYGASVARAVGCENIMWASDYPHDDSTWPRSRIFIDERLRHLSPTELSQVVAKNAATLYGLRRHVG